ncbi:cysteine hydrolase family protein [Serratia marcescens]|uniref:cysteine hydrolase family protein n=1 Tax=Serratia marcescens TaxID=615 RepID=UPI00403531F7
MQRQKTTLPPNRTRRFAVLVIDMQYDFLDESAPVPCEGGRAIIAPLQVLLNFARGAGIPVIYTQESHRVNRVDFGRELDYGETLHCLEGSRGVEIIADLSPQVGDQVLIKRRYSAFFATDLDLLLRGIGVDTVVLTGVATDVCVRATAQDAMQLDYRVIVPRECVAGTRHVRHEAALENIGYVFGRIQSLAEVMNLLRVGLEEA